MKKRIAKLIDVKSILTLVLTGVFSFLAVTGTITSSDFMTIFTVVYMSVYLYLFYRKLLDMD